VSRYYQDLDRPGGFDYRLFQIPALGAATFRGPEIDLSRSYLACVGAAQTFGRFVAEPYPALLGARLGIPVLNLGIGGAGPRQFLKPAFLQLLNQAEAVVIQVLSGRSASNSLFDNSVSGGMVGRVRVDQSMRRSDEFFREFCATASRDALAALVAETRDDYMASFIQLLQKITAPKILLWLSTRPPGAHDDYSNPPNSVFGPFPQLVNRKMAAELAACADEYVESISSAGLPQRLWRTKDSIDGAVARGGVLENHYYPSPQMHEAAADALEAPCRRFLGRARSAPAARFLLVAAARTGTNLLLGLLNDHPGCYGGGELFNVDALAGNTIPWREMEEADRPALLELRRRDPVAFWHEISGMAAARGFSRVGFKLLYSQGFSHRALLDRLAADSELPVIHLKRRNLLRRLVSERQAYATGKWAATPAQGEPPARPAVRLEMAEIVTSIRTTEEHQEIFDRLFAGHPVLNLVYEDLAARPDRVAARAAAFLGLAAPATPPAPKFLKTGHDTLETALTDYEALRAKWRRWGGFFDG